MNNMSSINNDLTNYNAGFWQRVTIQDKSEIKIFQDDNLGELSCHHGLSDTTIKQDDNLGYFP